mmetsp:Transcript_10837/g.23617  ORF Transcript_10837/g.23617 Transcript_10837/m.23617 type:complete len:329 (-) Transcript_10837:1078-2064(-)
MASTSAPRPNRACRRGAPAKQGGQSKERLISAPVPVALEVEEELQNASLEAHAEAALVRGFPLAVDDLEGEVLVRRTPLDAKDAGVLGAARVRVQRVGGRLGTIDEVGVEDIELVPLHHLGRRVVVVEVGLVVLVPLVPRVDAVEVLGLARLVLIMPPRHLVLERHLEREARLAGLHALARLRRHLRVCAIVGLVRGGLRSVHRAALNDAAHGEDLARVLLLVDGLGQLDLLRREQRRGVAAADGAAAARRSAGGSSRCHLRVLLLARPVLVVNLLVGEQLWRETTAARPSTLARPPPARLLLLALLHQQRAVAADGVLRAASLRSGE